MRLDSGDRPQISRHESTSLCRYRRAQRRSRNDRPQCEHTSSSCPFDGRRVLGTMIDEKSFPMLVSVYFSATAFTATIVGKQNSSRHHGASGTQRFGSWWPPALKSRWAGPTRTCWQNMLDNWSSAPGSTSSAATAHLVIPLATLQTHFSQLVIACILLGCRQYPAKDRLTYRN